jgi:hypothetical protein
VEIHHRHVAHAQRSCASPWVDLHNIPRSGNEPKQAVRSYPRVVIMNLLGQVCRSDRTGVNVQSDENESALMMLVVFAHKLTLHESHVSAKSERLGESGPCARPTDLGIADGAIEVGYL